MFHFQLKARFRDNMYSNKSWCLVKQGIFELREVSQMVHETCQYLD